MALPPRPKGRALVRRAVVASVFVAGCDQGAKPSVPPPAPDREKQEVLVPPQVAWDAEPAPSPLDVAPQVAHDPVPPQVAPSDDMPPQVAYKIPPKRDPVPPQVNAATGFTLVLVDDAQKPIAKTAVKVTLPDGTVLTATTSERGTALIRTAVWNSLTVAVTVRGYEPATEVTIDGGRPLIEKVVLTKRAKR